MRDNHNVSTEAAIEDVTAVLKRHIEPEALERHLAAVPADARRFWGLPPQA